MGNPELIFIVGCNAAGKSSFIRTRLNELANFEIIMTDVSKGRSKEVVQDALNQQKNIVLETVFNDASFKDLVDKARHEGYQTSLIVLFLDSPTQSLERVAFRSLEQNGLPISDGNVKINFNENFKNVADYFLYFDHSDFYYTGITNETQLVMTFEKSSLVEYKATNLLYPQRFADYSFGNQRLDSNGYQIIKKNLDFVLTGRLEVKEVKKQKPRLRL
jgi:predicted ABC-type ATPase